MMKRALLIPVLALAACTDLTVEGEPRLSCTNNDDCPDGFFCATALSECVDEVVLEDAPLAVVGAPSVDRDLLSYADGFDVAVVSIEFNKVPTEGPAALFDNRLEVPCAQEGETAAYTCTFDLGDNPDEIDGGYDIVIDAADAAGNEARGRVRVELDVTAPAVAPGSEVLRYEAKPESPIRDVTALSGVTTALLQLTLTELPEGDPVVEVKTDTAEGRAAFVLDADRSAGALIVLTLDSATSAAAAALTDGAHDIEITVADAVGNSTTVDLDSQLLVDFTAPAAPDTGTADQVVYSRLPWGERGAPNPRFSVDGLAGAVEGSAEVFINVSDDAGSALLGTAVAAADGSFSVALNPIDLPRVFARAVDSAGNLGPAAAVRDIAWTASMGGKVRGETFLNPHVLYEAQTFDDARLVTNLVSEVALPSELVDGDALGLDALGRLREERTGGSGSQDRMFHDLAFHPRVGAMFLFGGLDRGGFGPDLETFVLTGETWTLLPLPVTPPDSGPLVYDPDREQLLTHLQNGETWAFDGFEWLELPIDPPTTTARGAVLAYDPLNGRVVRHGGFNGGALDETWVLEGDTWSLLTTGPALDGAMGFDAIDGRLILYDGTEVHALDGATWTELTTAAPAMSSHSAVENLETGRVDFVCGEDGNGLIAALRTWDGAAITAGGASPAPRHSCGAAFDPLEGRTVVHGGLASAGIGIPNPDTSNAFFFIEDGDWAQVPDPISTPGHRNAATDVFYDHVRERTVIHKVFGGNFLGFDTLLWDGRQSTGLPGFVEVQPFFDGVNSVAVEPNFAILDDGGGWGFVALINPPALPDSGARFVYHETLDAAFAFGGTTGGAAVDETFTLRQFARTNLSPATTPPARSGANLIYDAHGDRVVMISGQNNDGLTDTWAFEDGDWRQLGDLPAGITKNRAQLLHDRVRGRTMLWETELYELRGDAWVEVGIEALPNSNTMAFFDEQSERVTFIGGTVGIVDFGDIFTWDGSNSARAAHIAELDLTARAASAGAVIESVVVTATAGGRGFAKGAAGEVASEVSGARLLGWGRTSWSELATNSAGVDAPDALTATVEGAALDALLRDRIIFALTSAPQGPGGEAGEAAAVETERLEVTVRYREP
jgi:hypothetical protein